MKLANITLQHHFNTPALDVYNILTDERKHASFTGQIVRVSDKEQDEILLCDGTISGKNIILERGAKIIWALQWHNINWPKNHFSEAAIILKTNQNSGCELTLFHTAIPEGFEEAITSFWQDNYWPALGFYLDR